MNNKVQPKILPGFMELLPQDQILFNKMYDTIRSTYERFGFLPLDTPTIELSEVLLAKAGGETEKQIYRFNKGENDLSLRFDLTVPLARYVAEHYNDLIFPFKRYQMSKVFRGERPQKGRFREFYQCDIDVIGNEFLDPIYDAEIPAIIYNVFKELKIPKFTISINNRKLLNGYVEYLNLSDKASDILRIIDKLDKYDDNEKQFYDDLDSINVSPEDFMRVKYIVTDITGSNTEKITKLKELNTNNELFNTGLSELELIFDNLKYFDIPEEYCQIDLSIARGLDYYTGTVYETKIDDYPKLGSICSGGRYDNLTAYYTDQELPGVGISIGLTRLFSQLMDAGIITSEKNGLIDALIIPLDKGNISYSLDISSKLRDAGVNVDVYYLDKGMKQKMKYADRLNIPYVILIGEDEVEKNLITLKDMIFGEQELMDVKSAINKLTK